MNPETVKIEASWRALLEDEFKQAYFDQIVETLRAAKSGGKTIYPPGSLIFKAFELTPCDQVKVVILGQDPYHNPGEAMGLCFSVPKGVKIPPSLKNIYREMHEDIGFTIPTHGDLTAWAEQGVLLLNAMLTVEHRSPGSHRKIGWQEFTNAVIRRLSARYENLVFVLWGNFARGKKVFIDSHKHLVLESAHPSPLAGKAFFGNHHFSQINSYLSTHAKTPILWDL